MAYRFKVIPKNVLGKPEPFNLHVPEQDLSEFRELLQLSKIGPVTWWNQHTDGQFGISREWLSQAKETWLTSFDWRKHEKHINSFPNFKITVKDVEAGQIELHFTALFSENKDAIPIVFLHGFPASFTEFLPMMQLLADKYTPETLPYHIIAPSLPGYGLSGSSSQNVEMTFEQAARIMNQLMIDLGFDKGYVAQGGDLGSLLARIMSVRYDACKAFHLNMLVLNAGDAVPPFDNLTTEEMQIMERTEVWRKTGLAFALEHGTRPSTVGLTISSNPLALLAWIGEKLLEWVDQRGPLSIDTMLSMVSFYWFTDTFPRSLYHAEMVKGLSEGKPHPTSKEKPLGYSMFVHDLAVLPQAWAKQIYPNLAFFKAHSMGGHFASLEQPEAFLEDIEEFVESIAGLFTTEQ
ncbi:epoxide hydrolase [Colletotrichum incanum]|uniref:Epoxide hydrolase n=1 Tax=Colletotrichum incanum TaxID=1573173 RepID=A0A161Y4F5_COLIC|nr:epoxide hydrolase [Colletotrichum incanum]OHW99345.1 epoxide hydrolase [Colletotrichum incanum]